MSEEKAVSRSKRDVRKDDSDGEDAGTSSLKKGERSRRLSGSKKRLSLETEDQKGEEEEENKEALKGKKFSPKNMMSMIRRARSESPTTKKKNAAENVPSVDKGDRDLEAGTTTDKNPETQVVKGIPVERTLLASKYEQKQRINLGLSALVIVTWVLGAEGLCLFGGSCGSPESGNPSAVSNGGIILLPTALVTSLVIVPVGVVLMSAEVKRSAAIWAAIAFMTATYLILMSFVYFGQAGTAGKKTYGALAVQFYGSQEDAQSVAVSANASFAVVFLCVGILMTGLAANAVFASRAFPREILRAPAFTLLSQSDDVEDPEKKSSRRKKRKTSRKSESSAQQAPDDEDDDLL